MGPKTIEAPAFLSLILFLGLNYVGGYYAGLLVTGSAAFGVLLALAMPLISLVVLALVREQADEPHSLRKL